MKRFLIIVLCVLGIPLLLLLGIYLWTDPFRTLHPFRLDDCDATNREYQSVELFRRNYNTYKYNSFVFCSSMGSGLNTYTWKMYLPDSASTFLFQAWGESISGMRQKILWLDRQNVHIANAIILLDIPGSCRENQLNWDAVGMKHYLLTGRPKWLYHAQEYYNFIQRPSFWVKHVKKQWTGRKDAFGSDTITNDYFSENAHNYMSLPKQDSLCNCSEQTRRTFMASINQVSEEDVVMEKAVISPVMKEILCDIHHVFEKQGTDYYIIVTPAYRYVHPYLNTEDLRVLQEIFGEDRVFDFTTDKELTSDFNDFFDPVHFGTILGWKMLKKIYGGICIADNEY